MNDEFLYRLRAQPSLKFATKLKAKLDLQSAIAASRKRLLYIASAFVVGAAALAFVSPPVRERAAAIAGYFRSTNAESTPIDVTKPAPANIKSSPPTSDAPATPSSATLETDRKSPIDSTPRTIEPRQEMSSAPTVSGGIAVRESETSALTAPPASIVETLPASGYVRIDGSSTTFPLSSAVAQEFRNWTRGNVRITVDVSGAGGGFKKLCRGETDISGAARPITRDEMGACAAAGVKYIEVPVAYYVLAVVVNSNAWWVDRATVAELKTMWEPTAQQSITRWNQADSRWPNERLNLFGPNNDSTTFDYFSEVVIGNVRTSRLDYSAKKYESEVVYGVARNRDALGFVGYAAYTANMKKVKALKIVNSAGVAVDPSEKSVLNRSYNPLSRLVLLYVNAESAKKPEVKTFVEFYLSAGTKVAKKLDYVPLPLSAYQTALTHFHNNKLGTVFGGNPTLDIRVEQALERDGEL